MIDQNDQDNDYDSSRKHYKIFDNKIIEFKFSFLDGANEQIMRCILI